MRLKRETKLGLATLAMVVLVLTTIAAVPGIFSSVNSTNGYQVNGSAGSSGQALCSDGTNYNTACTAGGGTITAVNVTSPIIGGGSSGAVSIGLGVTGTSGTYIYPIQIVTDTFGRVTSITSGTAPAIITTYETHVALLSGTPTTIYDEDFDTGALGNNTTTVVSLPHAIPSVIMAIQCSDNSSRVQSGNTQAVGANVSGQSSPYSTIQVLSPASGENAYCHVKGY